MREIVVVHWHDAGSGQDEEDAASHFRRSVGYLVRHNRRGVWIAMEQDMLSQVHFIPRGMVKRVELLTGVGIKG